MKILISPAKTMRDNEDGFDVAQLPCFLDEAQVLLNLLRTMSCDELQTTMKCNRKIAELNYQRFQHMDLRSSLLPALFCYDGLQYKAMAPHVFNEPEIEYVKQHLVILSGFYGLLRAFDGVRFYRLEMQTELTQTKWKSLTQFWEDKIAKELLKDKEILVNLASKEYSQVITPYLTAEDCMITCVFGVLDKGKVKVKGTLAKMARGAMVRYMAEHQITEVEQLKGFTYQGFQYRKEYSSAQEFVFIQED